MSKFIQKFKEPYYIGLDLGTNSVGYAVTNENYEIFRFNKKSMWGSRLFDEAKTASDRRIFRGARRRIKRRNQRLAILKDFFYEEISKIDPLFFHRLSESNLYSEDKTTNQKNSLFNDENFTDKNFYEMYPTIYHLRSDLIYSDAKKDLRFVYLALHHIFKKRGHFLFEGLNFKELSNFENLYFNLDEYLENNFNNDSLKKITIKDLVDIFLSNTLKSEKIKKLKVIFNNKQTISIISLCLGSKVKLSDLFDEDDYKNSEKKDICFEKVIYEDVKDEYFKIVGEKGILLLDICKSIYDYKILVSILKENKYFSDFKVSQFENHKKDLKILKNLIKKYFSSKEYKDFFKNINNEKYSDYIYSSKSNKNKIIKNKIKIDVFYKNIKAILDKIKNPDLEDIEKINDIKNKIEKKELLIKPKNSDNGVIPYQLHEIELLKILENQEKYYDFLKINNDKILKTFKFKIPYYIGPLNLSSDKAWLIKKSEGKIFPWNFNEKIDIEKTAEKFIEKLINSCTYLKNENVIPKNSIIYEEFTLLNELNKVKINGNFLSVSQKNDIIENLFKKEINITLKKFTNYLKQKDIANDDCNITGILDKFNSNMETYIKFKKIFGEEKMKSNKYNEIAENIILWKCIYGDSYTLFNNKFNSMYKDINFTEEEIKNIKNIKFKGFGRLSYKFINKIDFLNEKTGEYYESILDALRNTNHNLSNLLSKDFNLSQKIEEINRPFNLSKTYKELIEESYISPATKRSVIQAIKIIEEIIKITKKHPKKIFVETTRKSENIKKISSSRKETIENLYKNISKDNIEFREEIEKLKKEIGNFNNNELRHEKLFLYFMQLGRCAYTNKIIDLNQLSNSSLYDIDHILPQSKIKDDSLDNKVLVYKTANSSKSDKYISEYPEIQKNMNPFWKYLKKNKFISNKKYERLTLKSHPDDEIQNFIARQLVITQQATKETIQILKQLYPETEIIYSSFKNANSFRAEYKIIKSRELNDFHHAKDAYLNIVSGDIFDKKFTKKYYLKDSNFSLNLKKVFKLNDTIKNIVLNTVNKNNINLSYQAKEEKGQLFNLTICKKSETKSEIIPFKPKNLTKDIKNLNEKYGYFESLKPSYFVIFKSGNKKIIERIKLTDLPKLRKYNSLEKFLEEEKNYKNISNLFKVKKNQEIQMNNFNYLLVGLDSTKSIELKNFYPLILPDYETRILKNVSKFLEKNKNNNNNNTYYISFLPIEENDEKNETYDQAIARYNLEFNHLYDVLCNKLSSKCYENYCKNSVKEKFISFQKSFNNMTLKEKAEFLNIFIKIFNRQTLANLKKFNEKIEIQQDEKNPLKFTTEEGRIRFGSNNLFKSESYLIFKSITGLFVKKVKI